MNRKLLNKSANNYNNAVMLKVFPYSIHFLLLIFKTPQLHLSREAQNISQKKALWKKIYESILIDGMLSVIFY